MKRLHFKEKAYREDLKKKGYVVEDIYLFSQPTGPFISLLKVNYNGINLYIQTHNYNEQFFYEDIVSYIEHYCLRTDFIKFANERRDFMSHQIHSKIMFDNLNEARTYHYELSQLVNVFLEKFNTSADFFNELENIDLSHCYKKVYSLTEEV